MKSPYSRHAVFTLGLLLIVCIPFAADAAAPTDSDRSASQQTGPMISRLWEAYRDHGEDGLVHEISTLNDDNLKVAAHALDQLDEAAAKKYSQRRNPYAMFIRIARRALEKPEGMPRRPRPRFHADPGGIRVLEPNDQLTTTLNQLEKTTPAHEKLTIGLRRGKTYTMTGHWILRRSGPVNIVAVGEGDRPVLYGDDQYYIDASSRGIAFRATGIHFKGGPEPVAAKRSGTTQGAFVVRASIPADDEIGATFVFEDCEVSNSTGLNISRVESLTVRGCHIHDNGNGIFGGGSQHFMIEGNVFNRNGLNSWFDHHIYIYPRKTAVVRNNLFGVTAGYAAKIVGPSDRVEVYDNAVAQAAHGIILHDNNGALNAVIEHGIVRDNVLVDMGYTQPRGTTRAAGIDFQFCRNLEAYNNIVAHTNRIHANQSFIVHRDTMTDIGERVIRDNIMHRNINTAIRVHGDGVTVAGNRISEPVRSDRPDHTLMVDQGEANTWTGNVYPPGDWTWYLTRPLFDASGERVTNEAGVAMTESLTLDFAEWQATGRDQDSTVEAVEYVDATRTVDTFASERGITDIYTATAEGEVVVGDLLEYIRNGFEVVE